MPKISEVSGQTSAEHTNHRPDSVLLADVIRTGTKGFLTTNGEATSIHQVAEEFPT